MQSFAQHMQDYIAASLMEHTQVQTICRAASKLKELAHTLRQLGINDLGGVTDLLFNVSSKSMIGPLWLVNLGMESRNSVSSSRSTHVAFRRGAFEGTCHALTQYDDMP